eukprot:1195640-Prorocentrum_minimum.AAC.2
MRVDDDESKKHGRRPFRVYVHTFLAGITRRTAWARRRPWLSLSALVWLLWVYAAFVRVPFDHSNTEYSWVTRTVHPVKPDPDPTATFGPGFQYVHMGMLEQLPNGSIAAVFQAAFEHYEGSGGQSLFWSTSPDGKQWYPPSVLVKSEGLPVWSPVLHVEGGRLWAFFSVSKLACKYLDRARDVIRYSPGGDIMQMSSDDSGRTWSSPIAVLLYDDEISIPKVLANKLVVLSNGAWGLPFWREPGKNCPVVRHGADPATLVNGSAGLLKSGDQGLSWSATGHIVTEGSWLIENSIVELPGNRLLQLFRSKLGVAFYSLSFDGGTTWTDPGRSRLQNPNSKLHVMRIQSRNLGQGGEKEDILEGKLTTDGPLVVAYNNAPKKRTPLVIAISHDGQNWKTLARVETNVDEQFAYPTMLESRGRLYIMYTVMRTDPNLKLVAIGMKVASFSLKGVR